MFADLDLRKLSGLTSPDRAFLSVYLNGPKSLAKMEQKFQKMRKVLVGGESENDERKQFDQNVDAVHKYLEKNPLKAGSLCIFSCWMLDYFEAIPLTAEVADLVWVDSSPYIRPLAELQDEYENVAVVVADNKNAKIFMVSSNISEEEASLTGNVKNHVRKGGWSQQRYERRRDKELLHYARDIVAALANLDKEESFRRILLVGGKEILRIVHENLPASLEKKIAGEKATDLGKGDGHLHSEIMELFREEERRSEENLWNRIRTEYLRGGLGVAGLEDVLSAAKQGRVEKMLVRRDYRPIGRRCRDCENLDMEHVAKCSACNSNSLYDVDVIEEIVEILKLSGSETDFVDPIPTLSEAGDVAALLRY